MTEKMKEQIHKITMDSYYQGIADCCLTLRETISSLADNREVLRIETILNLLDSMEVKK